MVRKKGLSTQGRRRLSRSKNGTLAIPVCFLVRRQSNRADCRAGGVFMSIGTIILIILVIALLGGFQRHRWRAVLRHRLLRRWRPRPCRRDLADPAADGQVVSVTSHDEPITLRHGRARPGHPRFLRNAVRRGCPGHLARRRASRFCPGMTYPTAKLRFGRSQLVDRSLDRRCRVVVAVPCLGFSEQRRHGSYRVAFRIKVAFHLRPCQRH